AGHVHDDLGVEGRGGAERQALFGDGRRGRRGVGALLASHGGDQQGENHRQIDQPIGEPGKVHTAVSSSGHGGGDDEGGGELGADQQGGGGDLALLDPLGQAAQQHVHQAE